MKVEKPSSVFVPFKDHFKKNLEKKKEEKKIKKISSKEPEDTEKSRFIGWA
jgi:hypothetical protein